MGEIVEKLAASCLPIAFAAALSGGLFPPGDVPRQLLLVVLWFIAGIIVGSIWHV